MVIGLEGVVGKLTEVVHTKNLDSNENEQRTIVSLLKSPGQNEFGLVEQVRTTLVKKEEWVGNHWREYGEIYGVITGKEATIFELKDIDNEEQRTLEMTTGDRLYVPTKIALRIKAKPNTVIICLSENYGREEGTHKYWEWGS